MDEIRLAALAESTLRNRRAAADALDSLLCEMIARRIDVAGAGFNIVGSAVEKTGQPRPALLVLCFGEDAVKQGRKLVEDLK